MLPLNKIVGNWLSAGYLFYTYTHKYFKHEIKLDTDSNQCTANPAFSL